MGYKCRGIFKSHSFSREEREPCNIQPYQVSHHKVPQDEVALQESQTHQNRLEGPDAEAKD
jgi:hypothetical protein